MSADIVREEGIYTMSAEDYHADELRDQPALSSSIIKILVSESPLHAWTNHPKLNPNFVREESEVMDIGAIAHALLLEGESKAVVLDFPDWRPKASKEARDEARKAGRVPLLDKHYQTVMLMVRSARQQLEAHRDAKDAFTDGRPEQTIIWEESGLLCKARLDWLHDSHRKIDDYKTTGVTANPEAVSRTLFSNGNDIQAAWYIRGLKAIDPQCEPIFRFIYQETYPPYALSVIMLGPDALMMAERKIVRAMDTWRECLATNKWPGYPNEACYVNVPAWMEHQEMEKELNSVIHT